MTAGDPGSGPSRNQKDEFDQDARKAAAGDRGTARRQSGADAPNRILAIDGPAGAGKSTIAARMAERFGLLKVETGAMYRAFALKALEAGLALDDSEALTDLSEHTAIELLPAPTGNQVLLDGEDVTVRLRTIAISEAASQVSVHSPVRAWMVRLQQAMGRAVPQGIVMEGRDIGTVVFPEASMKIFLSASAEARTERRLAQENGVTDTTDAASLLAAMRARDARDQARAESPLRPAEDAVTIDSTALTLDQVVEQVAALVAARWQRQL